MYAYTKGSAMIDKREKWTRIKIYVKAGKWVVAKALPTSHPQQLVPPVRTDDKPTKRGAFSEHEWTIIAM